MCTLTTVPVLPSKLNKPSLSPHHNSLFPYCGRRVGKKNKAMVPLQGWYNRFQRDEVVAQWKKVKGRMSLHVHCHISGGHFLLDILARLRYFIFCKELPVVLKAVVHGDENLFNSYPELQDALVWVYFHSNIPEFNKVECWGPLKEASAPTGGVQEEGLAIPQPCQEECQCCFPPLTLSPIQWSKQVPSRHYEPCDGIGTQQNL
ncbi:hypothetical protein JHK85_030516 [Glycine max]|nr:hypothetical protein JHK85_030516 [Glycine max]